MDLDTEQIEEPPRLGTRWKTEVIKGIGKRDEDFVIILDIERIFSTDEVAVVSEPMYITGDPENAAIAA